MFSPFIPGPVRILAVAGAVALAGTALMTPAKASDNDLGAFIRQGTCATPGKVVEDIGDLDPLDADDSEWQVVGDVRPEGDVFGEGEGITQSIDDLTGSAHVVTVTASDDAESNVIACAEITGTAAGNGMLTVDLNEVSGSGYTGKVQFGPSDDRDETTDVTTVIWQGTSSTPEATPASGIDFGLRASSSQTSMSSDVL